VRDPGRSCEGLTPAADAFNGRQELPPHIFHLLIGGQRHSFGADWRAIDPGLRITTRFAFRCAAGGTFVQQR
jgi:hypothetical protein